MRPMKRRAFTRIVVLFLSLGLGLPQPAFALRQTGLEEQTDDQGNPIGPKAELVAALRASPTAIAVPRVSPAAGPLTSSAAEPAPSNAEGLRAGMEEAKTLGQHPLERTGVANGNAITGLGFSSDGRTIATGTWIGGLLTWDARRENQSPLPFISEKERSAFWPASRFAGFGPGLDSIVRVRRDTQVKDSQVEVVHVATGGIARYTSSPYGRVESVALSPDGKTIALGTHDFGERLHQIILRDRPLGFPRLTLPRSGDRTRVGSGFVALAFDPTGERMASLERARVIRIWDLKTGDELLPKPLHYAYHIYPPPDSLRATSLSFHPVNGRILAVGGSAGVQFFDTVTAQELKLPGRHLAGPYYYSTTQLAFSPTGDALATVSPDRNVRLWDTSWLTTTPAGMEEDAFSRALREIPPGTVYSSAAVLDLSRRYPPAGGRGYRSDGQLIAALEQTGWSRDTGAPREPLGRYSSWRKTSSAAGMEEDAFKPDEEFGTFAWEEASKELVHLGIEPSIRTGAPISVRVIQHEPPEEDIASVIFPAFDKSRVYRFDVAPLLMTRAGIPEVDERLNRLDRLLQPGERTLSPDDVTEILRYSSRFYVANVPAAGMEEGLARPIEEVRVQLRNARAALSQAEQSAGEVDPQRLADLRADVVSLEQQLETLLVSTQQHFAPPDTAAGMEEVQQQFDPASFKEQFPDQAARVPAQANGVLLISGPVTFYRPETLASGLEAVVEAQQAELPNLQIDQLPVPTDQADIRVLSLVVWDTMLGSLPYPPPVPVIEHQLGQPFPYTARQMVQIAVLGRLDASTVAVLAKWTFEYKGRQVTALAILA